MRKLSGELNGHAIQLRVNPDIARILNQEEKGVQRELHRVSGSEVTIKSDGRLHHEQFDVMAV